MGDEALDLARALVAQIERKEWSDAAATAYEVSYLASQEPPDEGIKEEEQ